MTAWHLPTDVGPGVVGSFANPLLRWEHNNVRVPNPKAVGYRSCWPRRDQFNMRPAGMAAWPLAPGVCRGRPVALRASPFEVHNRHEYNLTVIMFLLGVHRDDVGMPEPPPAA